MIIRKGDITIEFPGGVDSTAAGSMEDPHAEQQVRKSAEFKYHYYLF